MADMPVILGIQTEDQANLKDLRRKFKGFMKATLQTVAEFWHQQLLKKHFLTAARSKYAFEQRNEFYKDVIKKIEGVGEGKSIDLVLKGQSKRFMMAFPKHSGTSVRSTVTMRPPTHFTNPFIGTFTDPKTGKQKHISRQPDKVREVTGVVDEDRQALRAAAADKLQALIAEARQAVLTKTSA